MPKENEEFEIVQRAVYHPGQGVKLRVNNTPNSYWVNEELSFDSANTKMTGIDHFVGGIASSLVLAIMRYDHDHDQLISQLEARLVFGVHDPLAYIGVVGCDGETWIDQLEIVIYAVSLAKLSAVKETITTALRRCVAYQTLRRGVKINLRIKETY